MLYKIVHKIRDAVLQRLSDYSFVDSMTTTLLLKESFEESMLLRNNAAVKVILDLNKKNFEILRCNKSKDSWPYTHTIDGKIFPLSCYAITMTFALDEMALSEEDHKWAVDKICETMERNYSEKKYICYEVKSEIESRNGSDLLHVEFVHCGYTLEVIM
jgi:hypothetical protein